MNYDKKRIVCCSFCKYFMRSDHYGCWFCSLHNHLAEPDGRCTWGEEVDG